jgi:hypothetical protein
VVVPIVVSVAHFHHTFRSFESLKANREVKYKKIQFARAEVVENQEDGEDLTHKQQLLEFNTDDQILSAVMRQVTALLLLQFSIPASPTFIPQQKNINFNKSIP